MSYKIYFCHVALLNIRELVKPFTLFQASKITGDDYYKAS